MHRRVRAWLEAKLDGWTPCAEDPRVLIPSRREHSQYLDEEDEEREGEEPCDDDPFVDYPWELDECQLLYLDWNRTMGMTGGTSYETIVVPGLGTILVEIGFDGYVLLGGIRDEETDADTVFLDLLLRTNGGALNTCVLGGVPAEFSVGGAVSNDWIIDRLLCVFDDAGAWEGLLEECPWVWNADYEEPPLSDFYGPRLEELKAAYEETRPAMLGWPSGMAWEAGRYPWIRRQLGFDEPFDAIHEIPPRGFDDKFSPRNRWRMLERWLAGPPEGFKEDEGDDDE